MSVRLLACILASGSGPSLVLAVPPQAGMASVSHTLAVLGRDKLNVSQLTDMQVGALGHAT